MTPDDLRAAVALGLAPSDQGTDTRLTRSNDVTDETEDLRPLDEEFDTMMEVQRNPFGAFQAIQSQAALIRAKDAENARLVAERDILANAGNAVQETSENWRNRSEAALATERTACLAAEARVAELERALTRAREVKPLVWRAHPYSQSTIDECAVADAPFSHRYHAQRDPWASTYIVYLHPRLPISDSTLWWESKGHADMEAAKAAAQADAQARSDANLVPITAALQPMGDGQ